MTLTLTNETVTMPNESFAPVPTAIRPPQPPTDDEMLAWAMEKGLALTPVKEFETEFALSIATRLRNRCGKEIYQTAGYDLPLFSRSAAEALFPASLQTKNEDSLITWSAPTQADVKMLLGLMLEDAKALCAGLTRALQKPSERSIYVCATIIAPMEISWVKMARGVSRLYINFMFVLSDEAAEIHPPKLGDAKKKIEMELDASSTAAIRAQITEDVTTMASWGMPLSAGWHSNWMGKEAEVAAAAAAAARDKPKKRKPRSRKPRSRKMRSSRKAAASSRKAAASSRKAAASSSCRHRSGSSSEEESSSEESSSESGEEESSEEAAPEVDLDCEILEEKRSSGRAKVWFRVVWDHTRYEPAWEAWRKLGGAVGSPVETWEPLESLEDTPALARWRGWLT